MITILIEAALCQLWRVSEWEFQFRCFGGQFLTSNNGGGPVSAAANSPSESETFYIEKNNTRIHIRLSNGNYIKVLLLRSCLFM